MEEDNSTFLLSNELHFDLNSEVQIPMESNPIQPPPKIRRGILNLLSLNSLVCGVEIVSSCAFTYIPPLLLKSGFSEFFMTVILGVAPLLDMITVPALAEWSDNSTLKCGRRRPVIICLSLILILSLVIIPLSSQISNFLAGGASSSIHMVSLAVGVILLDYSYQAVFNPCEALLSDVMTNCDKNIQALGFSLYSACLSLGCIIGYLIVCVKWALIIPLDLTQDQMCFLIILVLLIPCLLLTLSNEEIPKKVCEKNYGFSNKVLEKKPTRYIDKLTSFKIFKVWKRISITEFDCQKVLANISISRVLTLISLPLINLLKSFIEFICWICGLFKKVALLPAICYKRIYMSPIVIQRVFFVELFGWTALHCHDRFFTDFVGQYLYAGDPNAQSNTTEATQYDEGIQMGSWCLFLQSLAACLYAFFIQQHLVQLLGARTVFLGGLLVFFLSMVMTLFLPTIFAIKIATALSGIGTATLTTTPNMLVTNYFQKKDIYMQDMYENKNLNNPSKERGLGTEVAVLDVAYYLSQVMLSFFLGPLVEIYKSSLMYILVSTGASLIALLCAFKVVFTPQEFKLMVEGKF
ncbi:UNVERIFIED_CONTAM: hypothetical protein RMT77_003486 [Armadillidium vulgare]